MTIDLTDDAHDLLLGNMGYDPTYGARPLKRVIQKHLVDPLALGLLQGDYREGDHVVVDAADGALDVHPHAHRGGGAEGGLEVRGRQTPVSLEPERGQRGPARRVHDRRALGARGRSPASGRSA